MLATHWGSDVGAWEIARGLAERLGASAVGGRWSRLVIDLNRQVGDETLVRTEVGGSSLPWNRDLSPGEVERRVMEYHVPYHAEIDRLLVRRLVRNIAPFLLAVHTFTPRLGRSRRRFDAGVLFAWEHLPGFFLPACRRPSCRCKIGRVSSATSSGPSTVPPSPGSAS